MRITSIRTRQVDIPLPEPFYPAWAPGRVENEIRVAYVRIDSDAGLYGIAGHGFYGAEEQCVARIATYLVGEDPLRIEKHAGTLRYLWPYFGAAVWFVEVALWDILGKVAGLPIYKLLGNARDTIVAYADTGQNRTPSQRADDARRRRDEGFRAIKLRIRNDTLAEDVALVAAVRKAVGDDMAILVDANQTDTVDAPIPGPIWTYHRALGTAKALADYGVYWLEEPLPRFAFAELQRLHEASPIPIAGGNSNQRLDELQRLLIDGCYDSCCPTSRFRRQFILAGRKPTELGEALRIGEGKAVEFKQEWNRDGILQAVTAFSNTNDGTIFVGISDSGAVVGLVFSDARERDRVVLGVQSAIRGRIRPSPVYEIDFLEMEGKAIGRIFVPKGEKALYCCDGRPYLRKGPQSVVGDGDEVARVVLEVV